MKLQTLKQLLVEMPPPQRPTGNVKEYGLILPDVSDSRISYDDIDSIEVYVNKQEFEKAVAKHFAKFTGNEDDVFLTYSEILDRDDFHDKFVEICWIYNTF